jgi:hypothetical protein
MASLVGSEVPGSRVEPFCAEDQPVPDGGGGGQFFEFFEAGEEKGCVVVAEQGAGGGLVEDLDDLGAEAAGVFAVAAEAFSPAILPCRWAVCLPKSTSVLLSGRIRLRGVDLVSFRCALLAHRC